MFDQDGRPKAQDYSIDFSALEFVEPSGVTSLANAVEFSHSLNCGVQFIGMNTSSLPIEYLDDSGFFQIYMGKPLRPSAFIRVTTVPIQRVAHSQSHFWLENKFLEWMSARLSMPKATLASIQTCMKEIFNNIKDHSGNDIGCIFIQHFPINKKIVIAISDFGIGIPTTIRRISPLLNDAEAIRHASEDGITSKSTFGNAGIGLAFLIRNVVEKNNGRVHISSGLGKLSCRMRSDGLVRRPWSGSSFYPGTLIELTLKTDAIVADDTEQEELTW
jgi:hypothetical protein